MASISDKKKVEMLELALINNNADEVKELISKYAPFEFTARSLGIASIFCGADMVELLLDNGFSYAYTVTPQLKRKYECTVAITNVADEPINYTLSLLPDYTIWYPSHAASELTGGNWNDFKNYCKDKIISNDERKKVIQLLFDRKIALQELLYFSIINDDTTVYQKLAELGVNELSDYRKTIVCGLIPRNEQDSYMRSDRSQFQKVLKETTDTRVLRSILVNLLDCISLERITLYQTDLHEGWDERFISRFCHSDLFDLFTKYTNLEERIPKWELLVALVDQNNAAGIQYAISEKWVEKSDDIEKLLKYIQGKDVSPALLGAVLSLKDSMVTVKDKDRSNLTLSDKPLSAAELKKIWLTQKLDDGTLLIKSYKGDDVDVVVPDCIGKAVVTKLDENTFNPDADRITAIQRENRHRIKSIILPDTITDIPKGFMKGHEKLEQIVFGSNLTSIGEDAFRGCEGLLNIIIPESVNSIGRYAFSGCKHITDVIIPKEVTVISEGLFRHCSSLESVTFNGEIVSVGHHAFEECSKLDNVTLPESVESIGILAFYDCASLSKIDIPKNVIQIGSLAFWGCDKLKISGGTEGKIIKDRTLIYYYGDDEEVIIPEGIQIINDNAFSGNSKMKAIAIPDSITTIGNGAFEHCMSLEEIDLPDSITEIGMTAFSGCEMLRTVKLPNGIQEIKYGTFENCKSLETIRIPESVVKIDSAVFNNCSNLKEVYIPNDTETPARGGLAYYGAANIHIIRYTPAAES